ncbi:MAG: hypothetical protein Q8P12_04000 [bacterium]|nr:hypothetical protein [bacterium]
MRERLVRLLLRFLDRVGLLSFAFHIKRVESTRDRLVFEHLWSRMWLLEGYGTKETLPAIREHYASYDAVSFDLLCTFLWIVPVGTMRVITGTAKLPALTDFQSESRPPGKVAEVTLLTIHRQFQGFQHRVALLLFREMYRRARDQGVRGIVVAADRRLWILLRRFLALSFRQIGREQEYEGSMTIPGYLDFEEQERLILQQTVPRNLLEEYVWKRFVGQQRPRKE